MEIALEDTGMVLGLWLVGQFLIGRNKQDNLGPMVGDQENQWLEKFRFTAGDLILQRGIRR